MQATKLIAVAIMMFELVAYGKGGNAIGGGDKVAVAPSGKMVDFVATRQDGTPLMIKAGLFNTPEAKKFVATKNLTSASRKRSIKARSSPRCIPVPSAMASMVAWILRARV
jgi:hypothetical protein